MEARSYGLLADVSEVIGTSPAHTRRLVRLGRIKSIKFGREWLIDAQSAREFKPRKRGI